MKTPFKLHNTFRYLAITVGLVFVLTPPSVTAAPALEGSPAGTASTPPAASSAAPAAKTDAPVPASTTDSASSSADLTNWVTFGVGGTFVNGDKGQFKHQHDTTTGPFGGLEDFHGQILVGKDGTFTADGHGIFGNHDYDLKLDLTDEKLGYVRAGFTEYRTWYDGTGGFYPLNSLSFQPYDNELYIDRRNAWVEAGLTLPDLPVFTFRYEYNSREGQMDSTSWGQTTLIPGGTQTRIVPSFQGIDETRHIFMADVKDKIDSTNADLGVRYEIDRSDDSTYLNQSPNQAAHAFITQRNFEKNDLFTVHGSTETAFDKMVTYSTGFSVTTMDTEMSGNRIYGPAFNTPLSTTFVNNGSGFVNLNGGGNTKDYVGNMNLMLTPIKDLVFVPAVRFEYEGSSLTDSFNNTSGHGGTFASVSESANMNNWYMDVTESLEARYTGLRDWSFYAGVESSEDWGNQSWNSNPVLNQVNFDQDWSRLGLKFTFGANWYPLPQLNFGTQYYHELHDYNYTNNLNPTLVQYPGYLWKQNFSTDDMNIRATWQALSTLSLITRYDLQFSTVDTWGLPNGGTQVGGVESATIINHVINESATWTPLACLYLQLGGSYVLNTLETPVAGSAGINNLVLNGSNNYWTVDASAGYEFNEKTHLQLQYSYYNAENYVNNAPTSLPFGAGAQENSVTATLTRQLSKEVQVSLKYGFYRNRDQTSGGQNNYDAQLVYMSTQLRF